ncbi:hypothetical protein HN371_21075 [Candidatus Poribacteria bacterium]|nr:hypothetical protein [Candidatus Poribacteria bacterium]MBT5536220.1 hypothetical protein [Candidatus Poribacteria bacterium]MBT5714045.1 hypothetical protein [Candidatus Poribacteria bacterium]MBT7097797.1 hypothetical protein [Candidatus Poribacteria bacterium]MBT7805923.1 hypothetical protein [Candidatus Poribacteria bacterium]
MKRNALYMFLGGLLVFMGHVASSVFTQDARGQAGGDSQHIDHLTCRSIDVIDADGRRRVSIAAGADGGMLAVWDSGSGVAALMASDDEGGVISVHGARGEGVEGEDAQQGAKSQVVLKATTASSRLWLLGPDGGRRIALDANALGGDMSFYDTQAKARATLLVLPEGVELALRARDEKKRAVVAVTPNEAGAVQTFHPEGERSGSMPDF